VLRRALRAAGWLAGILGVLVLGGLAYVEIAFPRKQEAPVLRVEPTPSLLARGEYLFDHVTGCAVCHTPHEQTTGGARIDPARLGQGGMPFALGPAGTLYADNITPTGLGTWTDGEIVRALRDGVSRDGTPLFPLMPYLNYRRLSEGDLRALVAYVRTLPPGGGPAPARELHFPMSLIVRLMPSPAGRYEAEPAADDPIARGRYLVTAASCGACHSPVDDRGRPVSGREFSGGNPFETTDGWVARSANLTPDSVTGIGAWTRDRFVEFFDARAAAAARPPHPGDRLSPMPWAAFAGMTSEDRAAIYDYLRTLEPVRHDVVRFSAPDESAPD
jgi:mono/diheme cytochrome c family protein